MGSFQQLTFELRPALTVAVFSLDCLDQARPSYPPFPGRLNRPPRHRSQTCCGAKRASRRQRALRRPRPAKTDGGEPITLYWVYALLRDGLGIGQLPL